MVRNVHSWLAVCSARGANAEDRAPVKGADNLYVYDSDTGAQPAFIGDCARARKNRAPVEDVHCPSSLNRTVEAEAGGDVVNDTDLWQTPQSKRR